MFPPTDNQALRGLLDGRNASGMPSRCDAKRRPSRFRSAYPGRLLVSVLFLLTLSSGCASTGPFVWYSELPKTEWGSDAGEYIIGPGDVISIGVYEQDAVSMKGKVRSDGRFAMTLLGEIVVAGKRPAVLAKELEQRLKQFIVSPRVTVNVEESQPVTISMLGEVSDKGAQSLSPPAGLLQALAQAGGLSEFASRDKIFVLRRVPEFRRIRFTYEAIVNNEFGAAMFQLRNGDVIVVE